MVDSNDEPYVPIDIPVENTTTDENGLALISSITTDGTLTFIANKDGGVDYESNTVNINKYDNVTISLSPSSTITANNHAVTLTGKVNGVSEPVTVNLSNVGNLTTDNQGNFSHTYKGQGAGNVTFNASVYSSSASVTIEDVIQYWKAPSTLWNRSYSLIKSSTRFSDVSNGYKIYHTNTSDLFSGIMFTAEYPFSIEFDVVSIELGSIPDQLSFIYEHDNGRDDVNAIYMYTSKGSHVKITVTKDNNNVYTIAGYVNNQLANSITYTGSVYKIGYAISTQQTSIIINNLKMKRLS